MENRDKITKRVSKILGVSQKTVRDVMAANGRLACKAISNKTGRSVYYRGIGMLMPPNVLDDLRAARDKIIKGHIKRREELKVGEDPIEF